MIILDDLVDYIIQFIIGVTGLKVPTCLCAQSPVEHEVCSQESKNLSVKTMV